MTRILKLSFGIFCLSLSFGLNAMALECFRCPLTGEIYGEFEEGTCGGDCLNWFLPVACERLFDSECELSDEYDFLNCDGSTYQTFPDDVDFICDQPDNICEGQIGGPVNLANGSMWYRPDADVSLNNPFPFEVRRGYWSTAAQRDHDRNIMHPLGWGWRINFYEWMEIKGAENDLAGIHRWNGALDRFYIREDHPQWKPEDGKHQKFSPVANGYELIDEDGISRIYEGSGIGEKFVMTSIAPFDVPEQAVQICYSTESDPTSPTSTCSCGAGSNTNVEGKPCQVKPASGPPIDVHWTRTTLSNKLVISSLSIGVVTVASYEYDSNDNLQYYYRGDTSSPEDWKYTYSYEYSHGLLHKVETPEIPTSTGSSPARIKAEEHEWTCSSSSGPCEVTRTKTPIEDYSITYASIPPDPLDPLAVATHKAIVTNNNVSPPLVYTIKFNGRGLPVEMSPASACRSPVSKYEYDDESVEKDG
ncbi:MAG: DUF6531 domain-containing protein, partial [Myxococcales bacterium]|nr:DUF6531 domain-containing protein [Myxococcales bacterium]